MDAFAAWVKPLSIEIWGTHLGTYVLFGLLAVFLIGVGIAVWSMWRSRTGSSRS